MSTKTCGEICRETVSDYASNAYYTCYQDCEQKFLTEFEKRLDSYQTSRTKMVVVPTVVLSAIIILGSIAYDSYQKRNHNLRRYNQCQVRDEGYYKEQANYYNKKMHYCMAAIGVLSLVTLGLAFTL